ncbi:hypothetical protein D9758_006087 [Tetrapyrgos nigripes]|uniref:Kinetochore protein NUF2 n=1 Tax=Tetrapyrgos nigripes TaxID=182062 RepID=A0A8H5D806_9AGAR|nr:hypothetical protein D9758_006087 [Tetrapyrgos nigripes]
MVKSSYPTMSISEIISSLSAWNLNISEEQLQRPTPEFIEEIYRGCLEQVTGVDVNGLASPVQEAIEACANEEMRETDLFTAALSRTLLVHHLTRFARAAQVYDFSSVDLSSPKKERTLMLLSAFINFIKFIEQFCFQTINDLTERSKTLHTQRDQVMGKLHDVQAEIDELQAKRAEDEPRCEQLRQENKEIYLKMMATKEAQKAIVNEVEEIKANRKELLQRLEAMNKELETVSDGNRRLRGRIVQSPERVKRTITTMSTTVIDDKKAMTQSEAKARDLTVKINALHKIEEDVRSCVEQLRVVEKEKRQLEESNHELADLRDQFEDKTIERSELQLKHERVQLQLQNAKLKLEQAQKRAEEKKAASQRTIERLQSEYEQMAIERRDNDQEVQKIQTQADEIEANMAEHLKTSETELNTLLTEYWKLRHETDVYMETLANKLDIRVSNDR